MKQWRISYHGFYWQLFRQWAELKHSDRWPQEAFKINLLDHTHAYTHTGPQLQHTLCQCISMWRQRRDDGCLTHRLRSDQLSCPTFETHCVESLGQKALLRVGVIQTTTDLEKTMLQAQTTSLSEKCPKKGLCCFMWKRCHSSGRRQRPAPSSGAVSRGWGSF